MSGSGKGPAVDLSDDEKKLEPTPTGNKDSGAAGNIPPIVRKTPADGASDPPGPSNVRPLATGASTGTTVVSNTIPENVVIKTHAPSKIPIIVSKGPTDLPKMPDDWEADDLDYKIVDETPPPRSDAWNIDGICATVVSPGYTLNQLLQDLNGSVGFSEDKAALGTIPTSLFLQITPGLFMPADYILGLNPFTADGIAITSEEYQRRIALFLYANHEALRGANVGLSNDQATFLTFLRLNVVLAGGVASNLQSRSIYVDEYRRVNTTWADVTFEHIVITQLMADFVASYWLQFIALLCHVFVTRGHHWKPEFDSFLDKTWQATTITPPEGVTLPPWQHIMRAGLHCFGIRVLHLLTRHAYINGTLAKSFVKRFHAAPAGTAPIRTGWAVIENMKKAHWWASFYARFKDRVDALEVANERTKELGLRAHINAKLFNWTWTSVEVSDSPVTPLAPYMLGFLDNLERNESIRNQKALDKRGDGGSAIRHMFGNLLSNDQRNAAYMRSVAEYFTAMSTSPSSALVVSQ